MTTRPCKAKDPKNCRYHTAEEYNAAFNKLTEIQKEKANARTLVDMEEYQSKIRQAILEIDATERGYAGLKRNLAHATKMGFVKKQASYEERLMEVQALRASKGIDD